MQGNIYAYINSGRCSRKNSFFSSLFMIKLVLKHFVTFCRNLITIVLAKYRSVSNFRSSKSNYLHFHSQNFLKTFPKSYTELGLENTLIKTMVPYNLINFAPARKQLRGKSLIYYFAKV